MNWADPEGPGRVTLAVMRIPAKNTTDYKGPLFYNPGVSWKRSRHCFCYAILAYRATLVTGTRSTSDRRQSLFFE